ncbi:MAG: sugar transporter [Halieaceae bacterium]|jgi:glycoside/pentoside/hexuronide:cation symporter, GPH family|nr:sugar transporter [Halieaceae bacterium]
MIDLKTRIFYGAGGAVYAVKEAAYTMFILMFYTQVMGLSGTLTGVVISISLVWDGISDPLVGTWSDRLRSRFGRRHPLMALSIIPLGLGFIGLFSPPQALVDNHGALAGWLLFWSLWVRTFLTMFSIPHLALSAEITSDYIQRSQVLGARMFVLFLFTVLLPAVALLWIFPSRGEIDGRFVSGNYPLYGALSCAIVWLMAMASTVGTRGHIIPSTDGITSSESGVGILVLISDLRRTLRNSTFRLVLGYDLAASTAWGTISTLNMLVWTYFWEFSAKDVSIMLSVPSILAIFLVSITLKPLSRRFHKQQLLQMALIGVIVDCLWLYPLKLANLLPGNGSSTVFVLNFIFMVVFIYCFLLRSINSYSIVADITDEHELEHGTRQEGGFFSVINLISKFASVIGPVYGGIALDVIGLETGMMPGQIASTTQNGLVYSLIIGTIPPLLVALYFALKIDQSKAKVEAIQARLKRQQS